MRPPAKNSTETDAHYASYKLWEERRGIHTYTVAAVYASLKAAAHFAEAFGEPDLMARYDGAAEEMKKPRWNICGMKNWAALCAW